MTGRTAPYLPPLRETVKTHGLSASKALGQNFLFDEQLLDRIAAIPGDLDGATVFEVGPGPGGLTRALLRAGAKVIAVERDDRCLPLLAELAEASGLAVTGVTGSEIVAPGMLASHYAPGKPVRLGAVDFADDEFGIGFGAVAGDYCLSEAGDLTDAAARLFDALHAGAASVKTRIAVAKIPSEGLGAAINDRLSRAAV